MDLQPPKCVWVGAKDFGATNVIAGTIRGVRTEKGKFGLDFVVTFELDNGELRDMTVWGSNYNYLYNTCGKSSEGWVGKHVKITQHIENGQPRRVIALE